MFDVNARMYIQCLKKGAEYKRLRVVCRLLSTDPDTITFKEAIYKTSVSRHLFAREIAAIF